MVIQVYARISGLFFAEHRLLKTGNTFGCIRETASGDAGRFPGDAPHESIE